MNPVLNPFRHGGCCGGGVGWELKGAALSARCCCCFCGGGDVSTGGAAVATPRLRLSPRPRLSWPPYCSKPLLTIIYLALNLGFLLPAKKTDV
jgi:hypothetical protein